MPWSNLFVAVVTARLVVARTLMLLLTTQGGRVVDYARPLPQQARQSKRN
jgi:hypothetical protein